MSDEKIKTTTKTYRISNLGWYDVGNLKYFFLLDESKQYLIVFDEKNGGLTPSEFIKKKPKESTK